MKIGRVSISNFKNIDNLSFDFRNKDTIIFDGPNGFGKTSFFDAVELAISGKINRVTNLQGKGGFNTLLLLKDQDKESLIKIELIVNDESITICRKTKSEKRLNKNEKKPNNWKVFHAYKLNNFEDDNFTETKLIGQNELNQLLKDFKIDQLFNIFFYVQQEETGFYLKMNEKERMDSLSILFNTEKQIQEKQQVAKTKNKLRELIEDYDKKISKYNKKKEKISIVSNENKNVGYIKVSPGEKLIGEWDSKEFVIDSDEKFNQYIEMINNIILLRENTKDFKNTYNNKKLNQLIEDNNKLQNIILFDFYKKHHEEILLNYNKLGKYIEIKSLLNKYSIDDLETIPLQKMKNAKLMNEEYFQNIEELLERKNEVSKQNTKIESSNVNLISARDNLKDKFEDLHEHSPEEISEKCPYCGANYNSYENVLEYFEGYKEVFNDILTTNSKYLKEINRI